MPIPANQLFTAEIIMNGIVASAGALAKNWASTHHMRRIGTAVPPDEVAVANAFMVAIGTPIMAALNARLTLNTVSVRFMEDPTRLTVFTVNTTAGSILTDSMATPNYAYLLKNTNLRGRNYRGNVKLWPMSETDTTLPNGDVWNAGALTRLDAIGTAILTGFTDSTPNTWKSVVYSRFLSLPTRTPNALIVTNDIIQMRTRKSVGTNRKHKVAYTY